MAINTIKATIQMRRGNEPDFDPDQMTAGEWAVSTDSKKVWMCFAPGIVRRMATYEAFEEDMKEIQQILSTCQDIQVAVEAFERLAEEHKNQAEEWSVASKSWAVGGTGTRDGEDADNARYYSEQAKIFADNAAAASNIEIMTVEKAGIGKPDGTTIKADTDGTLHAIRSEETINYNDLENRPSINGALLEGDKTLAEIGAIPDAKLAPSAGMDLDTLKDSGIWVFVPNRKPVAYPGADGRGWLLVIGGGTSGIAKHLWCQYGANNISSDAYTRTCKSDGSWSPWVRFATEGDVAALREEVDEKLNPTGDASDVTITFSQATDRNNLESKEKLSVSLGKIMKWLADLANGAANTLLGTNLTKNRALISSGNGKVAVSSVTATELGYLAGATSGIQGQLNNLNSKTSIFLTWYGVTIGIYRYGRIGIIATISGALTAGLVAYTKYTVGTIASGFRPLLQLTKIILIQGDVQAMLNITAGGVVELTPYAALAKGYVPLISEMYEIS